MISRVTPHKENVFFNLGNKIKSLFHNLFFSQQQSYENDVYQMGGCAQRPFVLLV